MNLEVAHFQDESYKGGITTAQETQAIQKAGECWAS